MNEVAILWQNEMGLGQEQLISLLQIFGDVFPNPLGKRIDLVGYTTKLLTHADIACALIDGEIVGFLAIYANDQTTRRAYIPIISIMPAVQEHSLGKAMMSRALALARQKGMQTIDLKVQRENKVAQHLYLSCGFRVDATEGDKVTMRCELGVT